MRVIKNNDLLTKTNDVLGETNELLSKTDESLCKTDELLSLDMTVRHRIVALSGRCAHCRLDCREGSDA